MVPQRSPGPSGKLIERLHGVAVRDVFDGHTLDYKTAFKAHPNASAGLVFSTFRTPSDAATSAINNRNERNLPPRRRRNSDRQRKERARELLQTSGNGGGEECDQGSFENQRTGQ